MLLRLNLSKEQVEKQILFPEGYQDQLLQLTHTQLTHWAAHKGAKGMLACLLPPSFGPRCSVTSVSTVRTMRFDSTWHNGLHHEPPYS